MKIEQFNSKNVASIGAEIKQAVEDVVKKYGLKLTSEGGRYTDSDFSIKYKLDVTEEGGAPKSLKEDARLVGVNPDKINETFTLKNGGSTITVKIVEIKLRNKKYPIIIENVTSGARYKVSCTDLPESMTTCLDMTPSEEPLFR
ncbi:hypothetical protein A3715_15875 [Oleiphilus sp. HI0009]|nr:hypothetical protein A3715_15875 [Oleiphilus sp. HI0009]